MNTGKAEINPFKLLIIVQGNNLPANILNVSDVDFIQYDNTMGWQNGETISISTKTLKGSKELTEGVYKITIFTENGISDELEFYLIPN